MPKNYALLTAQTLRNVAEAERDQYHALWVAACAERDRARTGTYCAYCTAEFPDEAPDTVEQIQRHVHECPLHPMRQVERDRDEMDSKATRYRVALETLEAERDHYHALWVQACAARDAADAYRAEWQALAAEYRRIAQRRSAERDALETVARDWAHYRAIARNPQTPPDVWWENTRRLVIAEDVLADAATAGTTPPRPDP